LVIDLRVTAVSAGTGTIVGTPGTAKSVTNASVGQTVTMNVWAMVTGTDPAAPDLLQSVSGSFLSSLGGLTGNLNVSNIPAQFAKLASSLGLVTDLDGDGDLDVGSNNQGDADNFFRARSDVIVGRFSTDSDGNPLAGFTANTIANGTEFRIAQLRFVVGGGGTTQVNFRPATNHEAAVWAEDGGETTADGDAGTVHQYGGGTTLAPDTGNESAGAFVQIQGGLTPEPTSLGLLGFAGMGLLARRRKA